MIEEVALKIIRNRILIECYRAYPEPRGDIFLSQVFKVDNKDVNNAIKHLIESGDIVEIRDKVVKISIKGINKLEKLEDNKNIFMLRLRILTLLNIARRISPDETDIAYMLSTDDELLTDTKQIHKQCSFLCDSGLAAWVDRKKPKITQAGIDFLEPNGPELEGMIRPVRAE